VRWQNEVRLPTASGIFLLASRAHSVSILLYSGYQELFPMKEAYDNSALPGAEVKDAQSYAFTALHAFKA
jgi:hypothetical protein